MVWTHGMNTTFFGSSGPRRDPDSPTRETSTALTHPFRIDCLKPVYLPTLRTVSFIPLCAQSQSGLCRLFRKYTHKWGIDIVTMTMITAPRFGGEDSSVLRHVFPWFLGWITQVSRSWDPVFLKPYFWNQFLKPMMFTWNQCQLKHVTWQIWTLNGIEGLLASGTVLSIDTLMLLL